MEKEVIDCFKKMSNNKLLWDKLGVYFGDASRIYYNLNGSDREYDILVYNVRTLMGAHVPVLNIEVESRSNRGVINHKHNGDYLLSFIFNRNNSSYSSPLESEKVYSTIVFNKSDFKPDTINFYADYNLNILRTKKNISQLEIVLNSDLSNKLKRGTLYFINDLFSTPGLINHYGLRHVFYEPGIKCLRAIFGTEENRKGVFFFVFDRPKLGNYSSVWIKNNVSKSRIQKYLSDKYPTGVAHYSNDDEVILITNELDKNIINSSKKAEVSSIVLVSGEKDSIMPGSSVKKIVPLKVN
jgi:hypothetical protein